jgi:phytoene dehydrogenase-like protein
MRDRRPFDPPKEWKRVPLVIVGGGVAGLSAAWRLDKRGFRDFLVLEMEPRAGGNSRWGENDVSAYPWAAHYLPVPDHPQTLVRELCEELGLLEGGHWNERWLCHAPQERLFLHGRWQEGLEPVLGATKRDLEQFSRFDKRMREFHEAGRFTIPLEDGLPRLTEDEKALDRLTLAAWMDREGFDSPALRWYADYCCRDDYGTSAAKCSAWVGIHYHAARTHEEKGPLTWPEGNGWIVKRLLEKLGRYVRTGCAVHHIARHGRGWRVWTGDVGYEAACVIYCGPMALAERIIDPPPPRWRIDTAPWVTANLTLDRWPAERGLEPAWDNVIYQSPSLGYVVATHQNITLRRDRTVWTYYWALSEYEPLVARRMLLDEPWTYWAEKILADAERAHPDIRKCLRRIDVFRIPHAMARPLPGVLLEPERRRRAAQTGTLLYAHADLSGFSIFEESQYRGVTAAERALKML